MLVRFAAGEDIPDEERLEFTAPPEALPAALPHSVPPDPAASAAPVEEKEEELATITLDFDACDKQGGKGGAHKVELKMAGKKILSEKPCIRENYVTQALKKRSLADANNVEKDPFYHFVVYTPAYRSRSQPMERMWPWLEWEVAKRLTSDRSMSSLQQAWVNASRSTRLKEIIPN